MATETSGYAAPKRKIEGNAATFDSILLALLILAMCSQMNLRSLGQDTYAAGLGFATKQLFIAVSDVLLVLALAWFAVRTSMLKAWDRLWIPPAPCWALVVAVLISIVHSQTILHSITDALASSPHHGPKTFIHALVTKESKEAYAHLLQYIMYFLGAPLLFVNLIHDRRSPEPINRRRLALHVFPVAILLSTLLGLFQLLTARDNAPHAFFGSPNMYGAFLALSLPLVIAHMLREWHGVPQVFFSVALGLLAAVATISSPWALLALLLGIVVAGILLRQVPRAGMLAGATAVLAAIVWSGAYKLASNTSEFRLLSAEANKNPKQPKHPTKLVRADFLRVPSLTQRVKRQYVEWYASLGWSEPRAGGDLPEGERLRAFDTGVGSGNYQLNIGPYYDSLPNDEHEKMPPDSNNFYLVEAVSTGLLGLAAMIWMIGYFAKRAWQLRSRFSTDWLGAGVLASLASAVLVSLFHPLVVRGTGMVLAFILSLAIVAWQHETVTDAPLTAPR